MSPTDGTIRLRIADLAATCEARSWPNPLGSGYDRQSGQPLESDSLGLVELLSRPGLRARVLRNRAGSHAIAGVAARPGRAVAYWLAADRDELVVQPFPLARLPGALLDLCGLEDRPACPAASEFECPAGVLDHSIELSNGDPDAARGLLTGAGVPDATAAAFVAAAGTGVGRVVVELAHRPSATTIVGLRLAWLDGGAWGLWRFEPLPPNVGVAPTSAGDLRDDLLGSLPAPEPVAG